MDECIKTLIHVKNILNDLGIKELMMRETKSIYNNNQACVKWTQNMTTQGLRHIQMQENAIRECVQTGFASIAHISNKMNPADIFTKEDRDVVHFLTIREQLMSEPPSAQTAAAHRTL
eukprot:11567881-Ditylum_brightwellii.AAC.1